MNRRIGAVVGALLTVLAVVVLVIGVLYLKDQARHLPSFLPGAAHHGKYKETHKAIAAFVAGVVLLVVAAGSVAFSRGSRGGTRRAAL
jgi:hypothetical protein